MSQSVRVEIPETLFRQLEKTLDKTVFSSVNDLILFILQDYLDKQSDGQVDARGIDDQAIRNRLKNLGYL